MSASGQVNAGSAPSQGPTSSLATEARPYRSHKIPACARCRKRKLRCAVDVPGEPCVPCRTSGQACVQRQAEDRLSTATAKSVDLSASQVQCNSANHTAKRRQLRPVGEAPSQLSPQRVASHSQIHPISQNATSAPPSTAQRRAGEMGSKSSMIVGPVMAEDVQMIEQYMSTQSRLQNSPRENIYDTVSDNPKDPILYLTVPRRRQGLALNNRPGEKQREIIEQIFGTFVDEAIAVYFEFVHPAFPILDEEHFVQLYKSENKSLSAALVCELLASALIFWGRSKGLQRFPCPNIPYVWNLAVAALQEEFLAPGMSTIYAALLDLNGRPTTSITGNTINSGRTVALSHILGLNRDPQTWKISDAEKNTRMRLWWGVLIHDRWSSFAHGVPTQISKNQYEVPIPTIDSLLTAGMETLARIEAAQCFIALCMLTEILGDILPLVYDCRQMSGTEVSKSLRRLETQLDRWEESEPVVSVLADRDENEPPISGASSLKLGFLSAKMLLCRIAFRSASHSADSSLVEVRQYSRAMLRESARAIITFMSTRKPQHLWGEFWLPYTAYHLASATIILLRCAIEASDSITANICKISLMEFANWMKMAKADEGWDLVDICLAQCEGPINQVCSNSGIEYNDQSQNASSGETNNATTATEGERDPRIDFQDQGFFTNLIDGGHMGPFVTDTQNSVNGFEYPWAELWDTF